MTKLANLVLKPLDAALSAPIGLAKVTGIYSPLRKFLYRAMKKSMNLQYSLLNGLSVEGLGNIPESEGAILAINHQSWLDAQVVTAVMPRPIHFIAKSELFSWPVVRFMVELADSLKIERGGDDAGIAGVVDALRRGEIVAIFPEGTIPGEEDIPRSARLPDTGLLQGKTGVVRMAAKAGVPIIPVGLSGTGLAFPPEAYPRLEKLPLVKFGIPITVKIGKPVDYESILIQDGSAGYEYDSVKKATERVMQELSALIDHSRAVDPMVVQRSK